MRPSYVIYMNLNKDLHPPQIPVFTFIYGCAIGIEKLLYKELEVISQLAEILQSEFPQAKLMVRPYPNYKSWEVYNSLLKHDNILLDNNFREGDQSVKDSEILKKFETIQNAKAFFHLGTTLGLEACFTDCPSFILDLDYQRNSKFNLNTFVYQFQNKKYIIDQSPLNTIKSEFQLREIISDQDQSKYLKFNQLIRSQYPLKSFREIADQISTFA